MNDFRVSALQNSSILFVYTERDIIELDPEYQRVSDVWTKEKRQLLIDSIINGFDIPKIYFHEFSKPKEIDNKKLKYAIVDGKQRLQTIWGFIDGSFALSNDFELFSDKSIDAKGLTYKELAEKFPRLKTRFDGTSLSIILIQTEDIDLIEEMFSRLNEAVPLNSPEKRNAFGGDVPKIIRNIAKHNIFKEKIPFPNKRYRYYDVAVKFLFLESIYFREGIRSFDTKKVFLDDYTKNPSKYIGERTLSDIEENTKQVLNKMNSIFVTKDKLLKSTGMLSVYYLLFKNFGDNVKRNELEKFEKLREENRNKVETEADVVKADYDLLEFDRLAWSPNDSGSIIYRYNTLKDYLLGKS